IKINRNLVGQKKYDAALQIIELAENKLQVAFGKRNATYAYCLFNHGRTFHYMLKNQEAEKLYLEAKEIQEKVLGKDNIYYAFSLNNLGNLYKDKSDYDKAESLLLEAKEIREKILGKLDSDYATSLNNLAILYIDKGEYDKSEPLFLEAKEIKENVFGRESNVYTTALNNLAILYNKKGDNIKVETLYLEIKEILSKTLGKETHDYANILYKLGNFYTDKGEYLKAEPLLLKSKEIIAKTRGKQHPDYARISNDLAMLYYDKGEYIKAESLYLEAKLIFVNTFGKEHQLYSNVLNNLAVLYKEKGEYSKAESLYLEATKIRKKALGKEHPDYAESLFNLASLYREKGDYAKAEEMALKAYIIIEKVLGKDQPDFALSLMVLANLYSDKGEYTKADSLYREVKVIYEKTIGSQHPLFSDVLDNLGLLMDRKGEYSKAETFYLEAIEIRAKTIGKAHPDYASSLNNLADLYDRKGEYSKAETFYLEAIEIRAKVLGKEHSDYASSLNNLAGLYEELGECKKAEEMYLKAKEIFSNTLGKEHPFYSNVLNNLAGEYVRKGEYDLAESLLLEGIEIRANTLGKEHPDYASSLVRLAGLYESKKEYAKAEDNYTQAIKIQEKVLGNKHPEYGWSLNALANLYFEEGDFDKAEPLYIKAKEIIKEALGNKHPDYNEYLLNLAVLYQVTNRIPQSSVLFLEMNDLNRHLIEKSSTYSSQNQMLNYMHTFEDKNEIFTSFSNSFQNQEFSCADFDNALFYKTYLLEKSISIPKEILKTDSLTQDIYERWKACNRLLAKEYSMPISKRQYINQVQEEAEAYEKTLTKNLSNFKESQMVPKWKDVRSHLQRNEIAIEFIRFRYYNPKITDSILYAALVLKPEDESPHYVYLCTEQQLKKLLGKWDEKSLESSPVEIYWPKQDELSLYDLIWKPIENLIPTGTIVWYSPAGLLHRLNLEAISKTRYESLADIYTFRRVGSTRQIAQEKTNETTGNEAVLFGGLKYDGDTLSLEKSITDLGLAFRSSEKEELQAISPEGTRNVKDGAVNYLPHTLTEVQNISRDLKKSGFKPTTYFGYSGTEEAFFKLGQYSKTKKSPRILHLATHGYFFPDPKEDSSLIHNLSELEKNIPFRASDNPLIRSGLLLSGSEHAWKTGTPASPKLADGILTAADIANMDLSNTELAVLSACETGLGDIDNNEGVFGLQRAFKIAGVHYLIMSLWKVDDNATMELMTSLYSKWLDKKHPLTIPEAFRSAQAEMRKKNRNPYYWAGFVLVE
ncbi:MAG TPA: tetratricopeptide repeat protein, partial [Saprospiraceae bacterium]|nr:tetratricopeptide repeat protein [Saprospiraceae bacterium]